MSNKINITYLGHYDIYTKGDKLKAVFSKFGKVNVSKPKVGNQFIQVTMDDIDLWLENYPLLPTGNLVSVSVKVDIITSLAKGIRSTLVLNPTYKTKEDILTGGIVTIENTVRRISKYFKSVAAIADEVDFESFMPEDAKQIVDYTLKGCTPIVSQEVREGIYKEVFSLIDDYQIVE